MTDITKILPITLIDLFNDFNESLSEFRKEISLESSVRELKFNHSVYDNIKIKYSLRGTSFYFEMNYLVKGDFIDWNYYPHRQDSTKPHNKQRTSASSQSFAELKVNFTNWKNIITKITNLKSPLDYFSTDDFIEFYSGEILEQIPTDEIEEKYPLNREKQGIAIELIDKQRDFIRKHKSKIKDKNSEEYFDFEIAEKNLIELKEDIPRMTVAQVKRKWSIPVGIIFKWCSDKFFKFLKVDSSSGYDLSRAIGSFFGGLFGIPKLDQ